SGDPLLRPAFGVTRSDLRLVRARAAVLEAHALVAPPDPDLLDERVAGWTAAVARLAGHDRVDDLLVPGEVAGMIGEGQLDVDDPRPVLAGRRVLRLAAEGRGATLGRPSAELVRGAAELLLERARGLVVRWLERLSRDAALVLDDLDGRPGPQD